MAPPNSDEFAVDMTTLRSFLKTEFAVTVNNKFSSVKVHTIFVGVVAAEPQNNKFQDPRQKHFSDKQFGRIF